MLVMLMLKVLMIVMLMQMMSKMLVMKTNQALEEEFHSFVFEH